MSGLMKWGAACLGLMCFAVVLSSLNIADGDLWARLAVGACFWNTGSLWYQDVFAFTQTLPHWIDHEWGAGVIFFSILQLFGADGLAVARILLAFAALCIPLYVARRQGALASSLLLIAVPAAWTILPGYGLVIRSHALTYVFFGITLLIMQIGRNRPRWMLLLPGLMLVWVNVHGGFVTGFAVIACYGVLSWAEDRPKGWIGLYVMVSLACVGVTLINPYGLSFWTYMAAALLHPRPRITEWAAMPLFGWDIFTGFRVFFTVVVLIFIAGWRQMDARLKRLSIPGVLLLILTAIAAWQHRRHAPFFGIAACAVLPAYLEAAMMPLMARFSDRDHFVRVMNLGVLILFAAGAGVVFLTVLPSASLGILAPVGLYPVRECDVLSRSGLSGNAAVPFEWGSYVAWRLHPKVKVSIDGRYEETFPEETFEMNVRFYNKESTNWMDLVQNNQVDFVMVDRRTAKLVDTDLMAMGFKLVWTSFPSELWAKPEHVPLLLKTVKELPLTTIQPLDAAIANSWPWNPAKKQ